jgi:hypothetical protein
MDGATRSSTGRSHGRRLPRFLFLRHGREETGVGSGNFGWFFWEKVATRAQRLFVCCNVFSYVVFCNPNRREEGGGRLPDRA